MTHQGYIRIAAPEDHNPDGSIERWTAESDLVAGQRYVYSSSDLSVWVEWGEGYNPLDILLAWQEGWYPGMTAEQAIHHTLDAAAIGARTAPWNPKDHCRYCVRWEEAKEANMCHCPCHRHPVRDDCCRATAT